MASSEIIIEMMESETMISNLCVLGYHIVSPEVLCLISRIDLPFLQVRPPYVPCGSIPNSTVSALPKYSMSLKSWSPLRGTVW